MFTFGYFNGNAGREITFDTKAEALLEAESRWSHLTEQEKKRYTEAGTGAYFAVFEGGNCVDDCIVVEDFAERTEVE